jgi:hypothetical protein
VSIFFHVHWNSRGSTELSSHLGLSVRRRGPAMTQCVSVLFTAVWRKLRVMITRRLSATSTTLRTGRYYTTITTWGSRTGHLNHQVCLVLNRGRLVYKYSETCDIGTPLGQAKNVPISEVSDTSLFQGINNYCY